MPPISFSIPQEINDELQALPVCAIDIGYSSKRRSSGVAITNHAQIEASQRHFGEVILGLHSWIRQQQGGQCVLILEGPLSKNFKEKSRNGLQFWNQAFRTFERGSGYTELGELTTRCGAPWYSGPGPGVAQGALTILISLSNVHLINPVTVHLFEGFHPRWLNNAEDPDLREDWTDIEVARRLIEGFQANPPRAIHADVAHPAFFSHASAAVTAGLNLMPDHDNHVPMIVFASDTLFATRPLQAHH